MNFQERDVIALRRVLPPPGQSPNRPGFFIEAGALLSFIGEDPIEKGLANSFARPGGRVTGVAMLAAEMDGKRASLLHDYVPAARRFAILTGRPPRQAEGAEEARRVARKLGLETDVYYADEPADYVPAFDGMRQGSLRGIDNYLRARFLS